jgi:WD40 repeat protein
MLIFLNSKLPLPTLLSFESERKKIKILETENRQLKTEIQALTKAASTQASSLVKIQVPGVLRLSRGDTADSESKAGSGKQQDRKPLAKSDTTEIVNEFVVLPNDGPGIQHGVYKPSHSKSPPRQIPSSKRQPTMINTDWKSAKPTKTAITSGGAAFKPVPGVLADSDPLIEMTSLKPTSTPIIADAQEDQPFLVLGQEVYGEHGASISHCCFSSTGSLVASADTEGIIKVWSFTPNQTKATLHCKSQLLCLGWANRIERLLLIGTNDSKLRLYDTEMKRTYCDIECDPQYPRVVSVCSSPNGQLLVYGCATIMSSNTGYSSTSMSYADPPPDVHLQWQSSRRKRQSDCNGALMCWDVKAMKTERSLPLDPAPTAVNCSAFNHNGNLLVTGGADGMIRLYDMAQWDVLMGWQAHIGEVYSVQFSCDETTVYSLGEDGKLTQWSLHHIGQRVADLPISPEAANPLRGTSFDEKARVCESIPVPRGRLFAFDSEGQHLLTCGSDHGLVSKIANNTLYSAMTLGGHLAPVVAVDWSTAMHCGACLTGSLDSTVRVTTLLKQ